MWSSSLFSWELIQTFLVVKRHRRVTTASVLLGVSNQKIRRQLQQLETLCGNRLFVAADGKLLPTQLGLDLGRLAEEISGLTEAFAEVATSEGLKGPANDP